MEPRQIVEELKARAARLRLGNKELAAIADLDETTVWRTFAGLTVPLIHTLDALEKALTAEERKLRQHLEKLERGAGGQLDLLGT